MDRAQISKRLSDNLRKLKQKRKKALAGPSKKALVPIRDEDWSDVEEEFQEFLPKPTLAYKPLLGMKALATNPITIQPEIAHEALSQLRVAHEKLVEREQKQQLFDRVYYTSACFLLNHPLRFQTHPLLFPLAHPLHAIDHLEIFVIVKDDDLQRISKFFAQKDFNRNVKVIPFSSIKEYTATYADKIKLVNSYDVFIVDRALNKVPVLPLLGKKFLEKNKDPIQVDFRGSDEQIMKRVVSIFNSTRMRIIKATTFVNVRFGRPHWDVSKNAENLHTVIEQATKTLPANMINKIQIKTEITPSLDIYDNPEALLSSDVIVDKAREFQSEKKRKRSEDTTSQTSGSAADEEDESKAVKTAGVKPSRRERKALAAKAKAEAEAKAKAAAEAAEQAKAAAKAKAAKSKKRVETDEKPTKKRKVEAEPKQTKAKAPAAVAAEPASTSAAKGKKAKPATAEQPKSTPAAPVKQSSKPKKSKK